MHRNIFISSAAAILAVATAASAADRPRIVNIGISPGHTTSVALNLTPDGSVVIGQVDSRGFRWTEASGIGLLEVMPEVPNAYPAGITDDGETIFGYNWFLAGHHPCGHALRWTSAGVENLNAVFGFPGSAITAISADGDVIAGYGQSCVLANTFSFLWEPPAAPQSLDSAAPHPRAMSADGSVIAGGDARALSPSRNAWRWTAQHGVEPLGSLPDSFGCDALAVTRDGAIIGGSCDYFNVLDTLRRPFIWTESHGLEPMPHWPGMRVTSFHGLSEGASIAVGYAAETFQAERIAVAWIDGVIVDLNDWLPAQGVNLHNWTLNEATAVNPAGDIIIGTGQYDGQQRAFIVYLGCYANCTGATSEPILTVEDFTCFINEFTQAQSLPVEQQITHYANCNHSTTPPILTVEDFTCFINAYAAGCP